MPARNGIQGRVLVLFLAAASVAPNVGCGAARAGAPNTPAPDDNVLRLEVENNNWQEMRVYLVHGRSVYGRRFVGTVPGGGRKTFELPSARTGQSVQLLLQPAGARSGAYLIPEPVTADRRIVLRVANILNRSLAWVP